MKTEKEIRQAVANSYSIAQALRQLGLKPVGGNYRVFKNKLKIWNIDTSHFTGQGHMKGKTYTSSLRKPLSEILAPNSSYQSFKLKNRLIQEKLIQNECYECGLKNIWNGKTINLHLDHINGDNTDNRLENLRILCPNCHSQTDNYTGKNKANGRN